MRSISHSKQGFTLLELMITLGIVGILAAIAVPYYQGYTRRAYFSEIVQSTNPYKLAVQECVHNLETLTGCNAGSNTIPPALTTPTGAVASISVVNGVITATPVAAHGLTATDTYILTPTVESNGTVSWVSSGGGVTNGYTK